MFKMPVSDISRNYYENNETHIKQIVLEAALLPMNLSDASYYARTLNLLKRDLDDMYQFEKALRGKQRTLHDLADRYELTAYRARLQDHNIVMQAQRG